MNETPVTDKINITTLLENTNRALQDEIKETMRPSIADVARIRELEQQLTDAQNNIKAREMFDAETRKQQEAAAAHRAEEDSYTALLHEAMSRRVVHIRGRIAFDASDARKMRKMIKILLSVGELS